MSHTTTVEVQFTDKEILKQAIRNVGLQVAEGIVKLYQTTHKGIYTQLPGWKYPIVFEEKEGKMELHYDNYNGNWGDRKILDKYMEQIRKEYVKETAKSVAKNLGGVVTSIREQAGKTIIDIDVPDEIVQNLA